VAKGILNASKEVEVNVPMVVRLVGTNEDEGRKLLKEANFTSAETLYQAAQMAVKLAAGDQK
jgi:succinyl-CoA synthetase beta subunit